MEKISEHVYWLPPAPPDRPSLCAVEGGRATIWLDAGSSAAHTREFLVALAARGVAKPTRPTSSSPTPTGITSSVGTSSEHTSWRTS